MSMTIGTYTVVNPHYQGGHKQEREIVGGGSRRLSGARWSHYITGQWGWNPLKWRVVGDDYNGVNGVRTALVGVEGTTFTLTDWLGNSETCELETGWTDEPLGVGVHEIVANFREVTA